MPRKAIFGAAGVASEQIISPSSNDWDYTFDGGGEWPVAGNSLGDHTDGAYIDNTGGDSALSSLFTFDGDFDIEWTATGLSASAFGVHAIDEDDTRTTGQYLGAKSMTNSFSWIHGGTNPKDFFIGSTAQSDTNDFANGSVIKIERRSGTIKVYDDGSEVHSFSTTYSGTMRFWLGAGGAPFAQNYDNILFTDYSKIQRDGMLYEGAQSSRNIGEGGSFAHAGYLFKATRSGRITDVKFNVDSVGTSYTSNVQIYAHDGTNPTGSALATSTSHTITTGINTWNFASPTTIDKGTWYWAILDDEGSTGSANLFTGDGHAHTGSGRHNTITSITDNLADNWDCEIVVDTSAGEPTPDHNTKFLMNQTTEADAGTTLTDSSQDGLTITNVNVEWDTAGSPSIGSSSLLFNGSTSEFTIPDSDNWYLGAGNGMTIDWRMKLTGISKSILGQGTSNLDYYVNGSGKLTCQHASGPSLVSTTSVNDGTERHFAVVWNGSGWILFVNGTSEATATDAVWGANQSGAFRWGYAPSIASLNFSGHIQLPRISNVARWDANFTPPTSAYS